MISCRLSLSYLACLNANSNCHTHFTYNRSIKVPPTWCKDCGQSKQECDETEQSSAQGDVTCHFVIVLHFETSLHLFQSYQIKRVPEKSTRQITTNKKVPTKPYEKKVFLTNLFTVIFLLHNNFLFKNKTHCFSFITKIFT